MKLNKKYKNINQWLLIFFTIVMSTNMFENKYFGVFILGNTWQ